MCVGSPVPAVRSLSICTVHIQALSFYNIPMTGEDATTASTIEQKRSSQAFTLTSVSADPTRPSLTPRECRQAISDNSTYSVIIGTGRKSTRVPLAESTTEINTIKDGAAGWRLIQYNANRSQSRQRTLYEPLTVLPNGEDCKSASGIVRCVLMDGKWTEK